MGLLSLILDEKEVLGFVGEWVLWILFVAVACGGCGCSGFCGFCLCEWILKGGGADLGVFDLWV
jgi:hypothetical protein